MKHSWDGHFLSRAQDDTEEQGLVHVRNKIDPAGTTSLESSFFFMYQTIQA
jgi:hypothetical protein